MKRISVIASVCIFLASCGNTPSQDKSLNTQENTAVEEQMKKDKQAMDSLEKAIQAQINGMDSVQ